MPFFILKTLLICTFLLTWAVLGLASISLIWRNKHKKDLVILLAPILLIYWGLTSYSTLYENFFLLQRTSLLPTLYCWGLTFLPPLLYFFIRFRITGIFPLKSQWWKHMLPSMVLSCCYILMSVFKSGGRSLNLQLGWNSIIVPGLVDTFPFNVYNNRDHTDFHLRITLAKYEWNRLYIPKISFRYSKKKHPNIRVLLHVLIEYVHFFIHLQSFIQPLYWRIKWIYLL